MENVPTYIALVFGMNTFVTGFIFYKASHYSKITLGILLTWLILLSILGYSGFYTVTDSMPPRLVFALAPPVFLMIGLLLSSKGKRYVDGLDLKTLTLLHSIRVPVEFILFGLFIYKTIPQIMTYEGRNLDILSGLTAPFMYYLVFVNKRLNPTALLLWNFICLGVLINIVSIAILAAPFPFQQFAFDQPNIAVLHFPFIWLPGIVVPLVLFSHLVSIRRLWLARKSGLTDSDAL